ncbi:MAG: bifunctional riboflavin kinase/FAD synthetase [Acidobacteria bacterium]|nr:bifunctional riboflavin kinase/FAD synthetase [Acidobacteriota bacterium]
MKIVYSPDGLDGSLPHPVAAVGNFDGVHLGHQRILETLKQRAAPHGGTVVVISFNPHPQRVLHPDTAPRLIATRLQKVAWLEEAGVDLMLELPFTRELSALTPEAFVTRILLRGLRVAEVHIGRNFRFGHDRSGDFETLEELGRRHGFTAMPVTGVRLDGRRISSSRVRTALGAGDVQLAAALLGREEELVGPVVPGDARGRILGFPTANLAVENELVPFTGVYATHLVVDDEPLPAVTNIGSRPTFPGAGPAVETHILDYGGDLYGHRVRLRFTRRLRDEQRFAGLPELKAQIALDVAAARKVFGA